MEAELQCCKMRSWCEVELGSCGPLIHSNIFGVPSGGEERHNPGARLEFLATLRNDLSNALKTENVTLTRRWWILAATLQSIRAI